MSIVQPQKDWRVLWRHCLFRQLVPLHSNLHLNNLHSMPIKHQFPFQNVILGLCSLAFRVLDNQLVRVPVTVGEIGDVFRFTLNHFPGDFILLRWDQHERHLPL